MSSLEQKQIQATYPRECGASLKERKKRCAYDRCSARFDLFHHLETRRDRPNRSEEDRTDFGRDGG